MRLVTIDSREVGGRPGVVVTGTEVAGGEILDIVAGPGSLASTQWLPQSVVSVLAAGEDGIAQAQSLAAGVCAAPAAERAALRTAGRLLPLAGTALLPPVRRPGLVLMLESVDQPATGAWIKSPNTAAAPEARVTLPWAAVDRLQVEARVAIVVGRPLFAATGPPSVDAARRAVAGFTLLADLAAPGGVAGGRRQFPGACPLGPAIVTPDEFPSAPRLSTLVNGHRVATADLPVPLDTAARILAALALEYALRPGDLVALPPARPAASAGRGDRLTVAVDDQPELRFVIG